MEGYGGFDDRLSCHFESKHVAFNRTEKARSGLEDPFAEVVRLY